MGWGMGDGRWRFNMFEELTPLKQSNLCGEIFRIDEIFEYFAFELTQR